jgi:glycosyltransferase involved in cell wall biosynthesis
LPFLLFPETVSSKQWICCQIGAREHYAVPRALHQGRKLAGLYTDYWAGPVVRGLGGRTGFRTVRSLASRFHPALVKANVVSWNVRSMFWEAALRKSVKNGSPNGRFAGFVEVGHQFACTVRDSLRTWRNLSPDAVLFAYDTGALEAFEWCREQEISCALDQMDPNRVEVDLVREEAGRWPGWELHPLEVPEEYFQRREREWALADVVVVNSEFCKKALIKQGVPAEKLFVLPLSYEAEEGRRGSEDRGQGTKFSASGSLLAAPRSNPLRVLFLGQVILRKGIQYLMEAARALEHENIRFDVVGPVGISQHARDSAPRNLKFHGRVSRSQAAKWYREADVFVLPTLSDGFAITQLEAMAHGLPVVTTPCCGEVVSDGSDGFIVPPRDAPALSKTFQRYLAEPELLWHQSHAAVEKAKQFTLDRLAANLCSLEEKLEKRGSEEMSDV